jgi:cytochrome P450
MSITTQRAPVLDFDHHSVRLAHHRDEVLAEVDRYPIFYTEANGGYWVVTSYDLTKAVLRDPETFSSLKDEDGTGGVTIPTMIGPRLLPAEVDAPYHRTLRRILAPFFQRSAVEKMRPAIEALTREAIDEVICKREFDAASDISSLIPARTMVEYLGFPESERVAFIRSIHAALDVMPHAADPAWAGSPELIEGMRALGHAVNVINDLIAERRLRPTDDLVSFISANREVADEHIMWIIFTLLVGGIENPAAMISNSLLYLSVDTTLRQRLIADPSLIPAAREELMRHITPGVSLARNITHDVEIGGVSLRAGERILLWLPGPNHDRTVFDQPQQVDIGRPACPHLAFGDGPHVCPGATLFRVQFQVLVTEILRRIPDYTVDLDRVQRYDDAATMCGFKSMPACTNL